MLLLSIELQQQLLQPPKPKMIIQKPVVDVTALERKIAELETDKTQYSDQLQQQCDVIESLKRDVASANARLSDVTGTWKQLLLCIGSYFLLILSFSFFYLLKLFFFKHPTLLFPVHLHAQCNFSRDVLVIFNIPTAKCVELERRFDPARVKSS